MRTARGVLKPHHQILMISLAALIAVAMVAFLTSTRVGAIHRTHEVSGRLVPITEALTNAELLYQADMAEAIQLLGPATDVPRATTISNITEKTRQADDAWATYKRLAIGVEGEKDLQFVAQASESEQVRLIAPVLSGKVLAAGTPERLAQAGATQLVAIETLRGLYSKRQGIAATELAISIDRARRDLLVAGSAELALLLVAFGAVYTSVRRRDRQVRSIELERASEAERNNLEARLARSLEMVHTEDAAYQRMERAISEVAGGSSEALIADSSHTHLRQVVAIGSAASGAGCSVGTPGDCPALVRGQTLLFPRSGELDACPYLDNRPGGPCSAACVPLSIGGKAIGILHVTSEPDAPPDAETISRLEIIAHKAGDRIGMLRAFTRSETEAHTDQLTGALNRRSLEAAVRRLTESGQTYAVAYGDLDHFKQLNDVYGHDAGDHALRLFSRVLRESLRPGDICARYGGEEFVIVLPACPMGESTQVLARIRENLARAQVVAATAPFTVSFGLAHSDAAGAFDDVLKIADCALAQAKEQGRDRVVTSAA